MAREFAAKGRSLALCARRLDRLQQLRDELRAAHPGIVVSIRRLDVDDHDQVFEVFRAFHDDLGRLDRVIVNAGIGKGQPIGSGRFDANLATARTNFIAALAQCEAAMEIFRKQNAGHLVVVSSMGALRGLPRNVTTYAATKAGVAALAEGIRAEMLPTPIAVTTLYPGYVRTDMNAHAPKSPLIVSERVGARAMVAAVEREPAKAYVPRFPWSALSLAMRFLPLRVIRRLV